MLISSSNYSVYKLWEFFSFGASVEVGKGIMLNPGNSYKLSGAIGYRIVAK